LLLSEVEENISRVPDRRLLRQNSHGLHSGIGARRIAEYLLEQNRVPSLVITLDTTPLFKGQRGLALYSRPWEFGSVSPGAEVFDALCQLFVGCVDRGGLPAIPTESGVW